jgi:colanic acid biosynthesis glycosyl transferase WcaI
MGRHYPGYSSQLVQADRSFHALDVRRCFVIPSAHSTMLSRLLENLSFGVLSSLVLRSIPIPDLVYLNSGPLVASKMIVDYCYACRIPVFMNVQDLYPETLVIQGRLGAGSRLVRAMMRRDRRIAQRCWRVNLISPRLAQRYIETRGLAPNQVTIIPNWVPDDLVVVDATASKQLRRDRGLGDDDFLIAYGGSISTASGVETLMRAFGHLQAEPDLRLLIAGSGPNLAACREIARGDSRIFFHSPYTLADNAVVLGAADLLILPTAGNQALAALPSKLLSYMQSARPIIALAASESDLGDAISKAGSGWVVPPDDPRLLAEAILVVRRTPVNELREMGQAGRAYCLREHGERSCLDRLALELEKAKATPIQSIRHGIEEGQAMAQEASFTSRESDTSTCTHASRQVQVGRDWDTSQ